MKLRKLALLIILFPTIGLLYAQENVPVTTSNLSSITVQNIEQLQMLTAFDNSTKQVSVSPDNTLVAIATQHGDSDYLISIFVLETGEQVSDIQGRMDFFTEMIWSPDSKRIAVISGRRTGAGVEERSVKVYTITSGRDPNFYALGNSDLWLTDYVNPSDTPGNPVDVDWNSTSELIAIAFYNHMGVFDAATGTELVSHAIPNLASVEWVAHDRFIITENSDNDINLWGIASSG